MYIQKKIDGKIFRKRRAFDKKNDAKKTAEKMRKRGIKVRIIPISEKGKKKILFIFQILKNKLCQNL